MKNKSFTRNLIIIVIAGLLLAFILPILFKVGLARFFKGVDEFLMNKGFHISIVTMNITLVLSLGLFIRFLKEVKKELGEETSSDTPFKLLINGVIPFGLIAPPIFGAMALRRMTHENFMISLVAIIFTVLHMILLVTLFYKSIKLMTKISGKRPTNILSLSFNKDWEKTADEREQLELYREGFYGFKMLLNSLFVLAIFYGLMSLQESYEVLLLFFILISMTLGLLSSALPKKR